MSMNKKERKIRELRQLQALIDEVQREAEERLNSLLEAMIDNGLSADIRQAALDFADVLSLFFYRMGIKDGTSVFAAA